MTLCGIKILRTSSAIITAQKQHIRTITSEFLFKKKERKIKKTKQTNKKIDSNLFLMILLFSFFFYQLIINREHYNIEISDLKQPLLLNRAKSKQQKQQQQQPNRGSPKNEIVCLIPELCFLTGLTDEIRSDATIKRVRIFVGDCFLIIILFYLFLNKKKIIIKTIGFGNYHQTESR
jgi:hypothetical protein